jgi:hypothetical protein
MKELKRAVIKEELVAITGGYKQAIVLQQFMYWTERVGFKRYDKFIEEESEREVDETDDLEGGWVYKTTSELVGEIMLGVSNSTCRRYITKLVDKGYLMERENPKYKWDNTLQYRINLLKIIIDLHNKGYHLEGYKYDKLEKSLLDSTFQNEGSTQQNENSSFQNEKTIPEITSENTYKDNIGDVEEVWEHYKQAIKGVDYNPRKFGNNRKQAIDKLLNDFTLDEIKKAINNATNHKFMMGDNSDNKFHLLPEKMFKFKTIEQYLDYKNGVQKFEEADYYADLR